MSYKYTQIRVTTELIWLTVTPIHAHKRDTDYFFNYKADRFVLPALWSLWE